MSEKDPAFQASSPKNFKGLVFGSAFFFGLPVRDMLLSPIMVMMGSRQRADQLIETHLILCGRRERQANPIQTPCQKQHGPLPSLIPPILHL
jgi:hypothetical protein